MPKIGDFGLAKLTEGGENLTRTSDILGTPGYMAPEQAGNGEPVGPACDLYALGAILYEALTGRPPFVGATLLQTLERVRTQEPIPPSRLQPTVPHDLEVVCLKCLHKAPARRYAGARELAEELQRRWLAGEPIHARPMGPAERAWKWRRRHPVAAALAVVATVLALAAGVGGFLLNGLVPREERDRRDCAAQLDEQPRQTRGCTPPDCSASVRSGESRVQVVAAAGGCERLPPGPALLGQAPAAHCLPRGRHSLPADAGVTAVAYRPGSRDFAVATDAARSSCRTPADRSSASSPVRGSGSPPLPFRATAGCWLAADQPGNCTSGRRRPADCRRSRLRRRRVPTDAGLLFDGRTLVLSGGRIGKPGTVLFWDARGARAAHLSGSHAPDLRRGDQPGRRHGGRRWTGQHGAPVGPHRPAMQAAGRAHAGPPPAVRRRMAACS
ncbi:MAG: serine/threonine-protein kinase [Gemmataceae bacterium]